MYRRLILTLTIVLFAKYFYGQDTLNYPIIEKYTSQYYTDKQWDKLIKLGKQSLRKNIDFYYLQVRMGIAYFETKRYLKAIKFLENAYKTDNSNTVVQETLYWSYIYSYMYNDAAQLYDNLDNAVKAKIDYTQHFIQTMSLYYSYGNNQNFNTLSDDGLLSEHAVHAERTIMKNEHVFGIDLLQPVGNGIFISHNLSFLNINYQKTISDFVNKDLQVDLKASQKQYYIQTAIPLGKRWLLSPAASLLWGYTQDYGVDTNQPSMTPSMHNYKFTNFLLSSTINKTWTRWGNQVNVSINNLDSIDNFQLGNRVNIFPFQNKKLVLSADYQLKLDTNRNPTIVKTFLLTTHFKYFSVYGFYTLGNIHNFSEMNGRLVYNQKETITTQFGGGVSVYLNKLQINVNLIQQQLTDYYFVYKNTGSDTEKNYKFDILLIKGGLLWQF